MKKRVSQAHSFSLPTQKRGQFYLIAAVIIIALTLSLVAISNSLKKTPPGELDKPKQDIETEAERILDYSFLNDLNSENRKNLLLNFTEEYSNYSTAENLYFLFGNSSELTVAVYRKETPAFVYVDFGSGDNEIQLSAESFEFQTYSDLPSNNIALTVEEVEQSFELREGQNFYFAISENNNGEEYIFTGGVIKK